MSLKDFLYLDVEKVRSYAAQIFGGLPETSKSTSSESLAGSMNGELGINTLLYKGGISGSTKGEVGMVLEETKSLHHQIYIAFEKYLLDNDKIAILGNKDDKITHKFIKLTVRLQIINYKDLTARLQNIAELTDILPSFQDKPEEKSRLEREYRPLLGKNGTFAKIIHFIKNGYQDTIAAKLFMGNELYAVTSLEEQNLQFRKSYIFHSLDKIYNEEWTVLAQIINDDTYTLPVLESPIDSAIAGIFNSFTDIDNMLVISGEKKLIPIAIYREL